MKKVNLQEALGVPSGIDEVAQKIYEKLISSLDKSYDDREESYEVKFKLGEKIGDLLIKSVKFKVNIVESDNPNYQKYITTEFATPATSESGPTEKLKIVNDFQNIRISTTVYVPQNWDFDELLNHLKNTKNKNIISISHELMHVYDSFKKGFDYAQQRASYNTAQNLSFGIKPIDQFLFLLYFTHSIENVTRPSELTTAIKLGEIDQKNFLNFLRNQEIYQYFQKAKNFSYENLREELTNYIEDIDELGEEINHPMGSNDEEKIDEILRLVRINLTNGKLENYAKLMTENMFEQMFGLQGEKAEKFRKYVTKINKFEDNESFFKNEEKLFQDVATKMIKKISKVYALIPEKSTQKSIKEWDLYHKIKGTKKNIKTKLNF
jgi:hypothetical protein